MTAPRIGVRVAEVLSAKATVEIVRVWSQTDLRADMAAYTVPTLVIHGDADQPRHSSSPAAGRTWPSRTAS